MKIFRIATRVEYKSYLEIQAKDYNEATKLAEDITFDNMNDEYQPSIEQHEYDKNTFEKIK